MQHRLHQRTEIIGIIALLLADIIWGNAFVAQVSGMSSLSPLAFNAVRFLIGALSLVFLLFLPSSRRSRPQSQDAWRKIFHASFIAGALLFGAMTCEQIGINCLRNAGESAFLNSLSILFLPLIALFYGKKIGSKFLWAVLLNAVGVYLLAFDGGTGVCPTWKDLLFIGSSLFYSIQTFYIERAVQEVNVIHLAFGEVTVAAILSWISVFLFHLQPSMHAVSLALVPLLYTGVISSCGAYSLQLICQKSVPAEPASIIMSLNTLFSVIGGDLILHETMNWYGYCGCILMLVGTIIADTMESDESTPLTPSSQGSKSLV